jgi:outer membrane protein assembly factor BamB
LDRESGFLRWSRRLDFIPSAQPFATQTHIFIPAADHSRVYALSVKDKGGAVDFFRAEMEKEENQITTRPIYEDPNLYFASHDGNIYSYREWKQGTTFRTGGAIKADPTVYRIVRKVMQADPTDSTKKREVPQELKFLFVGGMDNAFYAIDASNGQLLWKYECGGPIKTPAVAKDSTVYVKTEEGALFALNVIPLHNVSDLGSWRRDGERRWKIPLGERFLLKGRSYVYVLGPNSEIYAMDESTGDIAGRFKTRWLQHLITNAVDDFFYCATAEGHLFALKESKENY